LWYKEKQSLKEGFEISFNFQVTDPGADGFAFVIQNESATALGVGGAELGYGGISKSVAVEFDCYRNADIGDQNGNHISIQTRGSDKNSSNHKFSLGCVGSNISIFTDGRSHTVQISYTPQKMLEIWVDDTTKSALSIQLNLENIIGSETAYVGFTGATGGLNESHDILTWCLSQESSTEKISDQENEDSEEALLAEALRMSIENNV